MIWNSLQTILLTLLLSATQISAAQNESDIGGESKQPDAVSYAQITLIADTEHLESYHRYWQDTSLLQHLNNSDNQLSLWTLLTFENHLAVITLTDTYSQWRSHINNSSKSETDQTFGHYHQLISTALTLLFATVIFIVSLRLAKRSSSLLVRTSDLISRRTPKQGWSKALTRFLNGMAPLAPWVLLWLALQLVFNKLPASYTLVINWWAPLAELYIIYGLLCLLSEWLLLRISTNAGVFLGSEQNKEISAQARHLAGWIIWPWIVLFVINHWLGASLFYRLAEPLAWLFVWFALATLISVRQEDYLANIKQMFPEKTDPLLARLSSMKWFVLFAPLLLPLQLLQFFMQYLDQLLIDFDWYRRLSARWFRMRTKVLTDEETDKPVDEDVPQQYERWFSPESDSDTNFPVISTGLLEAVRKPVDAWLNDRTYENSLVVTGENGIGKTASLSRLTLAISEDHPEVCVHHFSVPAKTTSEEAVYKLIGDLIDVDLTDDSAMLARTDIERPPTLLILDEAQNLFLADVEHLDGWRALLNLINVRIDNLFWIVSINNQSWAYLCNVFGREYQIRNAIHAKRWSQDEIRSLILSRNHLSGYKLRYDNILLTSRSSEAGNLRNAEQRYFSLLWDSCRGIPMTALEMWLTSVRPHGRTVVVGLPQVPDSSVLEKLGSKLMFVYAAIVTHENLTFEEVLRVTNQQENVVRYALKSALDAEFIERSKDGRYRITSLWYQAVINYLARKNMLNE